jgi:hypothetical protein
VDVCGSESVIQVEQADTPRVFGIRPPKIHNTCQLAGVVDFRRLVKASLSFHFKFYIQSIYIKFNKIVRFS